MSDSGLKDAVGQRGEAIFYVALTRLFARAQPIFKPQFLGDKWPTVDYIVELVNSSATHIPYFFVQVKSTTKGTTKSAKNKRLKIQVTAADAKRLASFPAPTYVVGIDEKKETAYIASANEAHTKGLSSLSTIHEINQVTQDNLFKEVEDYWKSHGKASLASKFSDPKWR